MATDQAAPPAMQQLIENTEQYVRTELQNRDASHDFDHINRVRKLALHLGKLEGLDAHTLAVVEVAALLHDIRDWKYAARKPLLLQMGSQHQQALHTLKVCWHAWTAASHRIAASQPYFLHDGMQRVRRVLEMPYAHS